MKNLVTKTFLAVAFVGAATVASAQITGDLYENTGSSPWPSPPAGSTGADANAPIPGTATPAATFTVANGSLNFESGENNSNPYTVGAFLSSGGATATYAAGFGSSDSDANTIITMAGFVSMVNGQVYETRHDDGLELTIGTENVVNEPGPTSAENTPFTWTGASGNYAFSLEYSEINGAPGVLQTDLPLSSTVPDSATTLGMLSLGLGGLAAVGRRFRK